MKKRKWLLFGICLLAGITLIWGFVNSKGMTSHTSSRYIVLLERSKQTVIAEKKANEKMYPASMTKIMTTILALERISDLDREVRIPSEIIAKTKSQGASAAGFRAGEIVTIRDLLYGMMLPSGAECCYRLAKYLEGSEQKFAEKMNEKAKELGMKHTHFCNTTGLHQEEHYTTAKDMAVLLDYALKNEKFREIFTSMTYQVPSTNLHPSGMTLHSTLFPYKDQLILDNGQFLGGKTGYTSEAGLCLASLVRRNGKEYILVTAGADGDHQSKPYHVLDAVKIYGELQKND